MQVIQVNTATGNPPYDIYVCDVTLTYCYLMSSGVSVFPAYVNLPNEFLGLQSVVVKLIDSSGCELFYNISCALPTPSVTVTPSFTPTPTPTPTIPLYGCQCLNFDNTLNNYDIGYLYTNCNGILISDTVPSGQTYQVCGSNPIPSDVNLIVTTSGDCVSNLCVTPPVCVAPMDLSLIQGVNRIYRGCLSGYNPVNGTCTSPGPLVNIGSVSYDGLIGCNEYDVWTGYTDPSVQITSFKVEGLNITDWTQLQVGMRVYRNNTVPGGTCNNYSGANIWVNRNSLTLPYTSSAGKPIIVRIYQPVSGGPYYILNITDCQ